jgi:tetratricopeptide (TPR) repeat protein
MTGRFASRWLLSMLMASLWLHPIAVDGQMAGIVRGTVVDPGGKPVDGAKVSFVFEGGVNRTFEVTTDARGSYSQIGLAPGPYSITASKDGVGQKATQVTLRPGGRTTVNFELEPAAVKASPGSELLQAAVAAGQAGRHEEAVTKFNEALEANPSCYDCHYNLGLVHTTLKQYDKARTALEAARSLNPQAPEPLEALASVFNATRQFDEAAKASEAALALRKSSGGPAAGNAAAVFDQGLVLWNAGKIDEAVEKFQETLRLDPAHGESHYWLGMGHLNQGRMPEAAQELEIYLAREPGGRFAVQAKTLLPQIKKPRARA